MSKKDRAYDTLRKAYLKFHPLCEAHLEGCNNNATDIHHRCGRGEYYLDTTTWLAVCRTCHQYIELHPDIAKELGFSEERLNINNKNEESYTES